MFFNRFLWVLFLLPFYPLTVTGQELPADKKLIKGKLENGLTYYIYPNSFPKGQAVYRLFLKTGSLVETDEQRGLAHFLEHMAFNGTRNFPNDSLVRFLEQHGAQFGKDLNAHTSYNETVYKLQLPSANPQFVEKTLTILSDWAGRLTLDSLEIEKERGVVMAEWLSRQKGGESVEEMYLDMLLNKSRFTDRMVIGDTAVIRNFDHQELQAYYNDWYDPSLMAIAVVGDINPKKIQKIIKRKFGSLKSSGKKTVPQFKIDQYSSTEVKRAFHPSEKKISLNLIQLLPQTKPVLTEEDYSGHLEQMFLNQLLRNRIRAISYTQPKYAKASLQFSDFLRTTRVFSASVELPPARIDSAISDFVFRYHQIKKYGFDSYEIKEVKDDYYRRLKRKAETQKALSSSIIMDDIYADFYQGQPLFTGETELTLFEKTVNQIDSTGLINRLQTLLNSSPAHYLFSGYDQAKSLLPESETFLQMMSGNDLTSIPRYFKPVISVKSLLSDLPEGGDVVDRNEIKELDVLTIKLSNGATVLFRPSTQADSKITVTGFRKGGRYSFAPEDYVTSLFATNVIALSGAGNHSRETLSTYLNTNSASVRFLIDKLRTGVLGNVDAKDAESLFQLIYLKWMEPNAESDIFHQLKNKTIENLRDSKQTNSAKFEEDLSYRINGFDYTTQALNDSLVQNEFEFDRILPIYKQAFGSAEGYTFIIVSDQPKEEMEELAVRYLGSLPGYEINLTYNYSRPDVLKQNEVFERYDGITPKANVSIIYQKDSAPVPYNKFQLKSEVLALVIKMKLLRKLREEMGMVYSVGVSASSTPFPSGLVRQIIRFNTDPENVKTLIDQVQELLHSMAENPDSFKSELEDVKSNLLKDMQIKKQKDVFWNGYIRNSIFYEDMDWRFITKYEEEVRSIQSDELIEMLKRYYLDSPSLHAVQFPKNSSQNSDDYSIKSINTKTIKK